MRPVIVQRRMLMMLVTSLLLTLQVAGMHLHFCFDGQAPPLQMHVSDPPSGHGAADAAMPHVDENVPLGANASVRADSGQTDVPPLAPSLVAWTVLPPREVALAPALQPSTPPSFLRHDLLPPMRGPPLTAHA